MPKRLLSIAESNLTDGVKNVGDLLAGGSIAATFMGWLPEIGSVMAIIWTGIRIYEWARVRIFKIQDDQPPAL